MSKNILACNVLKEPFMQELRNAFKHITTVDRAFQMNDYKFFMGCDVSTLTDDNISFEEYFCRNILKKVSNVEVPGVNPTENARSKFIDFLARQSVVVHQVDYVLQNAGPDTSVGRVLQRARKLLCQKLSNFTGYEVIPRFTAGSTADLTKVKGSNPFNRYGSSSGWDVLENNLQDYFEKHSGFSSGEERITLNNYMPGKPGCKRWEVMIDFVPKTWEVDRVIGRQLVAPLAMQVGTGDYLTKIASAVGLHIPTAQERHKTIARLSSLENDHLMTLDQSSASDNILISLVKYLVPERFFDWLEAITPRDLYFDGGQRVGRVAMMATAGNGYIFPLQTLIFAALAKATCIELRVKPEIYSYGDDLIAPKVIYDQLKLVFDALGLQVNHDKTFTDGHFRESCGGDYFYGTNVRPLYVKEIPTSVAQWIRCINGIRRVGFYNNVNHWRTNNFRRFWNWCVAHIPGDSGSNRRLFAPSHYGDTAISHECERLYRLSFKKCYTDTSGVRHKYPNDGFHQSGHPYSGWYIETYALKSTGSGVSYGEAVKGVNAVSQMRLVTLDSVKGSGLRPKLYHFDDNNVKLVKPVWRVGYLPFFEKNEYRLVRNHSPYFRSPPAPFDNVAALFDRIGPNNQLFDTDEVVHRGKLRYENAISRVVEVLRERLSVLEQIRASASEIRLNF